MIGMTTGEASHNTIADPDYPKIIASRNRGDNGRVITGNEIIQENDLLVFVTGSTNYFGEIARLVGEKDPDMPEKPSVAIFGATNFGSSLAKNYLDRGSNVVIIEPDLDAANSIVGSRIGINKRLDVIHGDPQDEDLLRELAIEDLSLIHI